MLKQVYSSLVTACIFIKKKGAFVLKIKSDFLILSTRFPLR